MQFLSFVIPCYNSEHTLERVIAEIDDTVSRDDRYEIILVDDHSSDGVWEIIKKLARQRDDIVGVRFADNFGQHAALMAGYRKAQGDLIVSLDDDGQSPVDKVYLLIDKIKEGYDAVYARYPDKKYGKKESWFRKLGSSMALQMGRIMLNAPKDVAGSSFFVMRRYIMDEVIRYENSYPYVAGLVIRGTKNITDVCVEQRERAYGHTGYNFKKLFALWLNGFTAFSVKPLEIGIYSGIILGLLGFLGVIVTIIRKLINPGVAAGWSSLICIMLILGGMILVMLGLIGEYVGRIYMCINNAPQYVIREITESKLGGNNEE